MVVASFSGGGSESCGGTFGCSEETVRRLLNECRAGAELDGGREKAGLEFVSGGLNKLLDETPFNKSAAAESSADFWKPGTKLKECTPVPTPSPVSPNVKVAAGFVTESLVSSPWPTRSPEKLPRVSPPEVFGGCGSVLKAVERELGLAASSDVLKVRVGDPVPIPEATDFGVRENGSSPV